MPLPRPHTLENANVGNAVIHVSTNDINKGDSFKSMQLLKNSTKLLQNILHIEQKMCLLTAWL